MQIRAVSSDDIPAVCRLIAGLLAELGEDAGPDPVSLHPVAARVLDAGGQGFLAVEDGQVIAAILLNECAAIYAGGLFGEVTELYVIPDRRSSGVAAALMAAAVAEGRRRGWTRLEVGAPSQPRWARSLAFYHREGVAEIGPRLRRIL